MDDITNEGFFKSLIFSDPPKQRDLPIENDFKYEKHTSPGDITQASKLIKPVYHKFITELDKLHVSMEKKFPSFIVEKTTEKSFIMRKDECKIYNDGKREIYADSYPFGICLPTGSEESRSSVSEWNTSVTELVSKLSTPNVTIENYPSKVNTDGYPHYVSPFSYVNIIVFIVTIKDNTVLESFISFCDEMEIVEEGVMTFIKSIPGKIVKIFKRITGSIMGLIRRIFKKDPSNKEAKKIYEEVVIIDKKINTMDDDFKKRTDESLDDLQQIKQAFVKDASDSHEELRKAMSETLKIINENHDSIKSNPIKSNEPHNTSQKSYEEILKQQQMDFDAIDAHLADLLNNL